MGDGKNFSTLLQILGSEQQISQRTDQKALHLLSALGVVLVFFLVHFNKIPATTVTFLLITSYLIAAFLTLVALLLVIVPRIQHSQHRIDAKTSIKNPAFFGGISQFASEKEYERHLINVLGDDAAVFHLFADSIYVLGNINSFKNRWVRRGMIAFILALALELLMVTVVYFHMTY
jgi:hypothetical protein